MQLDNLRLSKTDLLARAILVVAGAGLAAFGIAMFMIPSDIAPSGISGIAVILNKFIALPVGLMVAVLNVPVQMLGYKVLRGWETVAVTVVAIGLYALLLELFPLLTPDDGISDDLLLNAMFGGILSGIGGGLIYRAGGTLGGSSTLARVLQRKFDISLTTSALFSDTFVLLAAGFVLGWESALYATVALFVTRGISGYILRGPSSTMTAFIMTYHPDILTRAIVKGLEYNVTCWKGRDRQEQREVYVLLVTIAQTESHALRELIKRSDPDAFVTVLQGKVTYGDQFSSVDSKLPFHLDEVRDDATAEVKSKDLPHIDPVK